MKIADYIKFEDRDGDLVAYLPAYDAEVLILDGSLDVNYDYAPFGGSSYYGHKRREHVGTNFEITLTGHQIYKPPPKPKRKVSTSLGLRKPCTTS